MPEHAPRCILTLASRADLAFVLAMRHALDALHADCTIVCGCLDAEAERAMRPVSHARIIAAPAFGQDALARAARAVPQGHGVLIADPRVFFRTAPDALFAETENSPAVIFGSGGGPVRAVFAASEAGYAALTAFVSGQPVPGATKAAQPAVKPWDAAQDAPLDCTAAALVQQRFLVPDRTESAPLTLRLLSGPLLPWAATVLRMAHTMRRADPDWQAAHTAPEWFSAHLPFYAQAAPPMPLLSVPQLPIDLGDAVLYLPPGAHGAKTITASADAGQPWPVTADAPVRDLGHGHAALTSGDHARAVEIFDQALTANRHDRAALFGLLDALEALGQDGDAIQVAQHFVDSAPDDAEAVARLTAARSRDLARERAASEIDDTGYRPRNFRVSVLVSTYASEAFMEECLTDLTAQTIADDIEILIVDAASPENERAVVRKFQEQHDTIRYLRTPSRIGIYRAWNHAALMATGTYLTPFSTNDRLAPNAYETLAAALDEAPEADLVFGDSRLTDTPHETFDDYTPSQHFHGQWDWPDYSMEYNLAYCTGGPHPMFRRSTLVRHGLFDERYAALADQDFFMRLGRLGKVRHIPVFTGLAWLSDSALSDESKTQPELLDIRARFKHAYAADHLALTVLANLFAELDSIIAAKGTDAARDFYRTYRRRLPAMPLVEQLDKLLGK